MYRTACFIDDGYYQNVLRAMEKSNFKGDDQTKWKTDYSKLVERMKGDGQLLRAYYYNCRCLVSENPTEEERAYQARQERFFYRLQTLNQFECRFGRLERRFHEDGTSSFIQKQVDVLMALDIATLSLKHLITEAKIISGDSDLIPAIQVAKNEGVIVELFYYPGSVHHELLQTVDIATEINSDWVKSTRLTEENIVY